MIRLLTATILALPLVAEVSTLHPRIYVRNDAATVGKGLTLSALRARLKDSAYGRWRGPAPTRSSASAIVERAARYLEEGSSADLAAVRDFLSTRTFSREKNDVGGMLAGAETAIAFDWVYAGLSEAERIAIMANLVITADSSRRFLLHGQPDINHNYTYMALNAVAVCSLVLRGEPEPYNTTAQEYLALARRFVEDRGRVLDTWNARQGAWAEGSHYTFHETVRTLILTLQAYRSATDADYFPRIRSDYGDFIRRTARFLIGCTHPDMTFVRTGDSSPNRVQASLTVPLTVEMLAAGIEDAVEAARVRSFARDLIAHYDPTPVYPDFYWGMRIFWNPADAVTPSYRTLPLFDRFGPGTYEQFVFRNGWDPASTHIAVIAGDHFTDHQHFDKGQFLIYHGSGLAVDSGTYDGMYKPEHHSTEYAPPHPGA